MKSGYALFLILGIALLSPAPALAQSVDPQRVAAAQTLYDQATADMEARRYSDACPKLEEVTRLVPEGLGAKLTLAECYEAIGKKASAWAQYVAVEALAPRANQAERAARAGEKALALKAELATITLEVPDAVKRLPGLAITRDGVPVGEVQWGTPVPADKGSHEIVIAATGRKTVTLKVEVAADGAKVTARATMPEVIVAPPPPPPPKPAPPVRPWQRPAAIGALSLGGAGLLAGGVLGGLAISTNAGVGDHCNDKGFCDRTGADQRGQARAFGDGSTAAFVAGGVLLAGGVVLFVTAPSAPKSKETARVVLSPGGLSLEGRFQ